MENFLEKIAEIFEEDAVKLSDVLTDFEAWDSLAVLSIIAMSDEAYGVTISAADLNVAKTVEGVWKLIESKREDV